MGIETGMYSNIQPFQAPSIADAAQKAMTLSSLGMQQQQQQIAMQQQQLQMRQQQAMRQAYVDNTGQDGQINQKGVLSSLGKMGYGQAAIEQGHQFAQYDKASADADAAKMDALSKTYNFTGPAFDHMAGMTPDQRAAAYPNIIKQLKDQGVDVSSMDHPYDPALFSQYYNTWTKSKDALGNRLTQANIGKTQAETEKTASETYKRNPDILGQTNDPAKLVPGFVPKEHQAKAFGEIDAAENTKRMSNEIMRSFDSASEDNTVLKTGAGMIRTPASVMALHQALQPTFKDLEGTVRQAAMDNTFKNVTPAPGDSEKTIATKRQALMEYLQSKASAPTARAYGIDLSRFDSTSAYKDSRKKKGSGIGSALNENSAYAGDLPKNGEVHDGYVFMGGDPSKPASWKKAQ